MSALPLFPRSQTAFQSRVRSCDADICADIYQQIRAPASTSRINSGRRRRSPRNAAGRRSAGTGAAKASDVQRRRLIRAGR